MIKFVNAKINIGLNIVGKRDDGYHLLETVFYPVGLFAGTPGNPESFCDILELTPMKEKGEGVEFIFTGNPVDCPLEKNLVYKGVEAMLRWSGGNLGRICVRLDKHLPDGAGMGGGSADAVFAMKLIAELLARRGMPVPTSDELREMAMCLGADCPVFVDNVPAYAEGIGEKLYSIQPFLSGKWIVIVKPDMHISTKEAFAGVTPSPSEESLRELIQLPVAEWRHKIHNDFEKSLFPRYPQLKSLKEALYYEGAEYASMTGSGAALYGIFPDRESAGKACDAIDAPYKAILLL
ncbi:MAG: 4-(cytidine 5'-diphospho)-2-C-methyl-D-erythritol kinase [Muribaculaceae bacterium]|nr:4-(cytidine 5'-diphospho)-2-C-methyl-D-erythritol kinase [Muribaculaceae bacterium]